MKDQLLKADMGLVKDYIENVVFKSENDIDEFLLKAILKLTVLHELGHVVFSYQHDKNLGSNERWTNERARIRETQANFIASLFSSQIENMIMSEKVKLQPKRYRDLILNIKASGIPLNKEEIINYNEKTSKLFF